MLYAGRSYGPDPFYSICDGCRDAGGGKVEVLEPEELKEMFEETTR